MRKNNSSNRAPSFSVFHVAALLLCAVLLTSHFIGGYNARYVSSAEGSDSARVAKFGEITITEKGDFVKDTNKLMLIPGVSIKKEAIVAFEGSESATYVFLEINLNGWTPVDENCMQFHASNLVRWSVSEDWTFVEKNGDTYVYHIKGSARNDALAPNTVVSSHIIKDDTITVSENITAQQINSNQFKNLSITFRATAVQSIGFDSVEAAWTSVSGKGGQ